MGYVLDWYSNPSNDTSEPMYIIDIGAGFGKLSYLIMYSLLEMKEHWPSSDHPPFVYVVSDCCKDYVSLWQRDPYLSQFARMGYLDFAVFDCAADTDLILLNSHLSISPDSLLIPPFFLCSCVLSTLPQDVIKVEQTLSRGNLSVYQAPSSLDFQYFPFFVSTNQFFLGIRGNCRPRVASLVAAFRSLHPHFPVALRANPHHPRGCRLLPHQRPRLERKPRDFPHRRRGRFLGGGPSVNRGSVADGVGLCPDACEFPAAGGAGGAARGFRACERAERGVSRRGKKER